MSAPHTMLSPLHCAAATFPKQTAIKQRGQHISYADLSHTVIALGHQLRAAGVNQGQALACISSNNLQMICLYWACVDIGAIFFPISPRFPISQIQGLIDSHRIVFYWREPSDQADKNLAHCQALNVALDPIFAGMGAPINAQRLSPPRCDMARPCNAILTSGSSGSPKAAVHCLAGHIANAQGARTVIDLAQGDSWLLSLPLFHIGGLAILNRCALVAATVVLPDAAFTLAKQITQDQITHLSLVPAQLLKLLHDQTTDLSSIKALLLGGGAIPQDLLNQLKQRRIASFTSYGMTEMGSQITTGPALSDGSSGKLLPNRELNIVDGVILVRGKCLFLGYLSPEGIERPLDAAGWFYTKDRGEWDANGNLRILGRVDNMFISGGENIQPEEIEAALKQHPLIDDAIVFPELDATFGHLPAAIVRGQLTQQLPTIAAELEPFLADKIARFKRPRRYYAWPEDTAQTGLKVNRAKLIKQLKQTAEAKDDCSKSNIKDKTQLTS